MRGGLWMALWACVACSGPGNTDGSQTGSNDDPTTQDTGQTTGPTECDAFIQAVTPAPGETSVPVNTQVVLEFSEGIDVAANWSLEVLNAKGTATLAKDGMSAIWVADADLLPETQYTIEAEVCDDAQSARFTTTSAPVPLEDVEGNTYGVDWKSLTFISPSNFDLFSDLVGIDLVLLQLDEIDETTLEVDAAATVAINPGGKVLPFCTALLEAVADFSSNPLFTFGPDSIFIPFGQVKKGKKG
ncbi:MAG: Ig-like domain-containing protein, partial [Myxococcales bacterium]|nr:Ig-like domain-containing protein [Myxococcales bacterium]